MGRARRAWTRGDIRASAAGLGAQGKRGQGSSGHRGRLLAWRARPLALLGTERRHARGQVRAEQGRRHPRGQAVGGVRGKKEGESCSVGPAWQRLRVEGSEGRCVTPRPTDSKGEFEDCSDEAEEICRCPQEGPRVSEGLTDERNPQV